MTRRATLRCAIFLLTFLSLVGASGTLVTSQRKATTKQPKPRERLLSDYRTDSKLAPGDRYVAMDDAARLSSETGAGSGWSMPGKDSVSYAGLHVEFESEEAAEKFAETNPVISQFDRFADVWVGMEQGFLKAWEKTAATPGVVDVQLSGVYSVPKITANESFGRSQQSVPAPKPEEIIRNGVDDLKGEGVIIAIIDTGIDFLNGDFVDYENDVGSSRLLYYWDTTDKNTSSVRLDSKPPLSYPNGLPVGTLYDRKQLTRDLLAKKLPTGDLVGHGTACASIAAGNGRSDDLGRAETKGVAPKADLIGVRIGGVELPNGDLATALRNGYLLDAIVNWLDTVAGNRPLVISCSWGSQAGNSRIIERQLNARFPPGTKGRAIVFAAGNSAERPWHASVDVTETQMKEPVRWAADEDRSGYIEIDFNTDDITGITVTPIDNFDFEELAVRTDPVTHHAVAYIKAPEGDGGLFLKSAPGRSVKANLYFNYGHFTGEYKRPDGMIGSPGAASSAFSVASYDFNGWFKNVEQTSCGDGRIVPGGLSCYSSGGSVDSSYVKPNLAAPGQIYYATLAQRWVGRDRNTRGRRPVIDDRKQLDGTGEYIRFGGTSAATPYVSGVIALLMQKYMLVHKDKPAAEQLMPLAFLKRLLEQNATKDKFTSTTPNTMWGNGKLDKEAVRRMLDAIK